MSCESVTEGSAIKVHPGIIRLDRAGRSVYCGTVYAAATKTQAVG